MAKKQSDLLRVDVEHPDLVVLHEQHVEVGLVQEVDRQVHRSRRPHPPSPPRHVTRIVTWRDVTTTSVVVAVLVGAVMLVGVRVEELDEQVALPESARKGEKNEKFAGSGWSSLIMWADRGLSIAQQLMTPWKELTH